MSRLFEVMTPKGTFILFPHEMKKLTLAFDMYEKADMMRKRPVSMKSEHRVTYGEAMINGFYGGERSLTRFTISQLKYIKKIVDMEEKAGIILNYLGYFKSIEDRMNNIMQMKYEKEQRFLEQDRINHPGRTIKTVVAAH